jgi:hypothetical protein
MGPRGEAVAAAALSALGSLPKTGKPQPHEHTAFAAFAVSLPPSAVAAVGATGPLIVALATGTKCLPGSKRAADGSALNDCHAEALARRALVRWALEEAAATAAAGDGAAPSLVMRMVTKGEDGTPGKVELLPGVGLHLFVSHPPCGDAAILEGAAGGAAGGYNETADVMASSAGRTGAKPVKRRRLDPDNGAQEAAAAAVFEVPEVRDVESYAASQATGVVRRKPGRGDPTLSVSCSDKVARWTLLGAQGALLSGLLARPLYLESLTVAVPGGDAAVRERAAAALRRAFCDRPAPLRARLAAHGAFADPTPLEVHAVAVAAADLDGLGLIAGGARRVPCGASIAWRAPPSSTWRLKEAKVVIQPLRPEKSLEIEIEEKEGSIELPPPLPLPPPRVITEGVSEALTGLFGSRAGRARKGSDPVLPESQSALCRAALFRRFTETAAALGGPAPGAAPWAASYRAAKAVVGGAYQAAWKALLELPSPLEGWLPKPPGDGVFPLVPPPR